MELTSEPDYIEKPVIVIYVKYGDTPEADMQWTINDTPASDFSDTAHGVSFFVPEENRRVTVTRSRCIWVDVQQRIDRIPVPPAPTEQK